MTDVWSSATRSMDSMHSSPRPGSWPPSASYWKINYTILSARTIALVQVVAIVLGHIIGVIAAHDRAVRLFPPRQAVAGQVPLLILMIGYTIGGLLLLFGS